VVTFCRHVLSIGVRLDTDSILEILLGIEQRGSGFGQIGAELVRLGAVQIHSADIALYTSQPLLPSRLTKDRLMVIDRLPMIEKRGSIALPEGGSALLSLIPGSPFDKATGWSFYRIAPRCSVGPVTPPPA
jgi:hypothetical protein